MSLRTFQRMTMVGVLALGAFATGCDEDTTEPTIDAGKTKDSGPLEEEDSSVPDGGKPPPKVVMCGPASCLPPTGPYMHCCPKNADMTDANMCGADLTGLSMGLLKCLPRDVEGKPSTHCGTVLDALENEGKGGGAKKDQFEVTVGADLTATPPKPGMALSFPVCCTPAGICGVDGNMTGFGGSVLNLGTGCLDVQALRPPADPTKAPAPGTTEENGLPIIPDIFCNPADGAKLACKPIPPYLMGACAAKLDTAKMPNCILGTEVVVPGCGEGSKWEGEARKDLSKICVDNMPKTAFGCVGLVKDSKFLASIPNGACGCGAMIANKLPRGPGFCLSYTEPAICGGQKACDETKDCDPDGATGPKGPTDGTCLDTAGTGGKVNGPNGKDGMTLGDDIGDYCLPKPPAPPAAGSCYATKLDFCSEYTGSSHTAAMWKKSCEDGGADFMYLVGRCPATMKLGSCVVFGGKPEEVVSVYYSPKYTLVTAKESCTSAMGTWQ